MEIYYYDVNGEKVGPFTKEGLDLRIDTGLIVESTRLVVNGKIYFAGQLPSLSPLFEKRKHGKQQTGQEGIDSYTENNTKKDDPLSKKINQLENFIQNERSENRSHSKQDEKNTHDKKSRGFLLGLLTGGAVFLLAVLVLLLAFKNNLFHITHKTHQAYATDNGIEDSHKMPRKQPCQEQEHHFPREGETFMFYGEELRITRPILGIYLGETLDGFRKRMAHKIIFENYEKSNDSKDSYSVELDDDYIKMFCATIVQGRIENLTMIIKDQSGEALDAVIAGINKGFRLTDAKEDKLMGKKSFFYIDDRNSRAHIYLSLSIRVGDNPSYTIFVAHRQMIEVRVNHE